MPKLKIPCPDECRLLAAYALAITVAFLVAVFE